MTAVDKNIQTWSRAHASNVLANTGFTMDEGMLPSSVNDSVRKIMAALKELHDSTVSATAIGLTNNASATNAWAMTAFYTPRDTTNDTNALTAGQVYYGLAPTAPTGALTLAVSGGTAKPVLIDNAAVANGYITSGNVFIVYYDGTSFHLTQLNATPTLQRTLLGLGTLATQSGTFSGTSSGTNTGDQTNITGNAATVTTNANLTGPVTSVGNATTITDAAVSLAKMANLAQDQFIGRTTASTGVPETATITAAARTILDDTTVTAALQTIGGGKSLVIAHDSVTDSNVTGDGTVYTIVFDTEIIDRAADYNNTTGIFTCRTTGYHRINAFVTVTGLAAHTVIILKAVVTGQDYFLAYNAESVAMTGEKSVGSGALISMTAGDTLSFTITVSGGVGGKVVDIDGGLRNTRMSIELVA